ncbi:MAG: hypothetical protein WBV06_02770 [Acidimicrobiia bacterium]
MLAAWATLVLTGMAEVLAGVRRITRVDPIHDRSILDLADRVLTMRDGRIEASED